MEITSPRKTTRSYVSYTAKERSSHLAAWKRSGKSAQAYALLHGIRQGNLYRWKRQSLEAREDVQGIRASAFIPVHLKAPVIPPVDSKQVNSPQLILRSGNFECQLDGIADPSAMVALAKQLKREVFDV